MNRPSVTRNMMAMIPLVVLMESAAAYFFFFIFKFMKLIKLFKNKLY
jgi:hypothetical protein